MMFEVYKQNGTLWLTTNNGTWHELCPGGVVDVSTPLGNIFSRLEGLEGILPEGSLDTLVALDGFNKGLAQEAAEVIHV